MPLKRLSRKVDSRMVALGGVAMAVAAWFIDAYVDSAFFEPETDFWQSLLRPNGHEIWMRSFLSVALIGLGASAAYLLRRHESAEQELDYNRVLLEKFAKDLETQNAALLREIGQRKEAELKLAKLATTDPLTGINNRRKFDETLQDEIKREARYMRGLALIILDIDHFKKINDSYGHQAGDQALVHLSKVTRQLLRPSDSLGRWGGEEFLIMLPNTDLAEAEKVMQRLQRELTKTFFLHENERVLITFSAGVAERQTAEERDAWIRRADQAMYRAKTKGRNRVEQG